MSQVLLGFRNLAFRIAIFVALAAVLVWFLGGSLLARPETVTAGNAMVGRQGEGLAEIRLVQIIHPSSSLPSERITWHVESRDGARGYFGSFTPCEGQDLLVDATPLVEVLPDGITPEAWFAGRPAGGGAWRLYRMGAYAECPEERGEYPDRLEAERQLARVAAGLPVQSADEARGARDAVLRAGDPAGE
ncbi:MAG: hypothetical protein RI967_324 [Planctomycetota bacterium]